MSRLRGRRSVFFFQTDAFNFQFQKSFIVPFTSIFFLHQSIKLLLLLLPCVLSFNSSFLSLFFYFQLHLFFFPIFFFVVIYILVFFRFTSYYFSSFFYALKRFFSTAYSCEYGKRVESNSFCKLTVHVLRFSSSYSFSIVLHFYWVHMLLWLWLHLISFYFLSFSIFSS